MRLPICVALLANLPCTIPAKAGMAELKCA